MKWYSAAVKNRWGEGWAEVKVIFLCACCPWWRLLLHVTTHGQRSNKGHSSCVSNCREQGTQRHRVILKTFLFSSSCCQREILLQDEEQTFTCCPGEWQRAQQGADITVPAFGAVPSAFLSQKPPCPFAGRSNINFLHGCSPAFTLCSWVQGFISEVNDNWWWDFNTCRVAASSDLGGEGTDSWATTAAWLSGWALLNPKQEVILKYPIILTFSY